MKYFLFTLLLLAGIVGQAQMKGDTTKLALNQIVFLMQQNKELSDRLDVLQIKMQHLQNQLNELNKLQMDYINSRVNADSAEDVVIRELIGRPYLFYDPKGVRPGFYLTNSAGEYQIFVSPLK